MSRRDDFFDPAGTDRGPGLRLAASAEDGVVRQEPVLDAEDEVGADIGDPLLQALVWLTHHHKRPRSAASLRANGAADGVLSPAQAVRLMKEAGYEAAVQRRALNQINSLMLPTVILLNEGDACVLVRVLDEASGRYQVLFPGAESQLCEANLSELQAEYSGFCLLVSPKEQTRAQAHHHVVMDATDHWLWGTLKRFIPYYRGAMLAALLSNVLMLATGMVTAVIYDKVIPHQDALVTLWTLVIGGALALVFDLFAKHLRADLIDLAGRKADLIIGAKLFRHILSIRMEHKPASAGSCAHYMGQVETVRDFFASASMSVLTDLPFIIIFVGMVFTIGGPLGWVVTLTVPVMVAGIIVLQALVRRSVRTGMAEQAEVQGNLVEALEGLEDVKTSGAAPQFQHRYEISNAVAAESSLRTRSMHGLINHLSHSMYQINTLLMLLWGVYLIRDGVITQGALIGSIMFASRALAPLGSMVGLVTRYQGARAALQSIDSLMNKPTERDSAQNYVPLSSVQGRIVLRDVGFQYPAAPGQAAPRVLGGLNVQIQPGERIAVLGRIGSGKSTVLRLIAGLYQPTEGMVEVEGLDLRQIDPAEYRSHVGFVSQEPRLFQGTLRDNVLMGRGEVSAARLVEVARLTGLDRVVAAHPMGWDLPVGEMGGLLSGGQRQLVALARALVNKPKLLLMDEPTSSMDAQSEMSFLRQLKEAAAGCTLIAVTHRPAVLELVGRVMVMDGGKLVLDGPRDKVLAALSGVQPAATVQAGGRGGEDSRVHMHPSAQPVERKASV
nr:type I secretion system permease/ATPase [uncultured Roseateles sp.]